jgi:FkbM family methyltransferase
VLPDSDNSRLERWFTDGTADVDAAVDMIVPLLKGRRTCIQAGGCVGVWPLRLAQIFDVVYSVEAEPENFACLKENTSHVHNIECMAYALWDRSNWHVGMALERGEAGNPGAYYVEPDGNIPTVSIDDMGLENVDLIYLDIEGSEYDALLGATDTIRRCRPVIGFEDKGLGFRYERSSPVPMLEQWGYRMIGNPTRSDVVMAC